MIVCLVSDGETIGGWILDVPNDRMAMACKGEGVWLDGRAVRGAAPKQRPNGMVGHRIRKEFERQLLPVQRGRLGELSTLNCAGREYVEVLAGQTDFTLYRMTKPWDHAAGALMMEEAGGQALRFNGARFRPADRIDSGIIAAPSPETVAEVRAVLEAVELPPLQARA